MILVSGATGFVGSYLVCELLRQNKKVRALRRSSSSLNEFEFICQIQNITAKELEHLEWFNADILDLGDLELAFDGIDEVIHAAAIVSFLPSQQAMMQQVNVEGTANMVNLALHFGVKKFGYLSSIAAIGRSINGAAINENTKWETSEHNTAYSETKLAAEMEVWRGIQEGLNAVMVNPGVIIGACDFTKGTGKMFETAKNGLKFYTPGVNGFVDVRDVVTILLQLMQRNISGERYILVSENYPFRQFYDEACTAFSQPKPKFNTPRWLGSLGYRLLAIRSVITGKAPLLTKETTHAAYQQYAYDTTKIKQTLGVEFISVKDTIDWTCSWYR